MTIPSQPQIFMNGKKIDSDRIVHSDFAEDQIFVFESLRSYKGVIFRLGEHLNRLFDSARTIGLKIKKTRSELKKELASSLTAHPAQDAFLRLGVDRENSYILVLDRKRPTWIYEKGVAIKTVVIRRNLTHSELTEPKTSAFFNNVLAAMEKQDSDAYDVIFLDSLGYVAEGTVWNIFMVKTKQLFTPQVGILNGVTRRFVIECAEQENLPVFETYLTRHDFWNADEAFLTNTSGEIVPIRSLDGRAIGKEIPGRVTNQLMVRFHQELDKELNLDSHSRTL